LTSIIFVEMKNSRDYIGGIGPGFNRKNEFLKRDHIKVGMANADCVRPSSISISHDFFAPSQKASPQKDQNP